MKRDTLWESTFLAKIRRGMPDSEARASADAAVIARDERERPARPITAADIAEWKRWPKWFKWSAGPVLDAYEPVANHTHTARMRGKERCGCDECEMQMKAYRREVEILDNEYARQARARRNRSAKISKAN